MKFIGCINAVAGRVSGFPQSVWWIFAMLAGFVWPMDGWSHSVIVTWDRSDSHTNLAVYVVKYGASSGLYTGRVDVATNMASATVEGLNEGLVYYFVVVARSVSGLDSYPSREVAFPVGNVAPVARADRIGTLANRPRIVALDDLLLNDDDQNGDSLSVLSVSTVTTNGAALLIFGANLIYTPVPNYTGSDLFTYSVSDGRGGTATADVLVTVRDANDPAVNRISQVTVREWGILLQMTGVPGLDYTIERSTDLESWAAIAVITAPPSGAFEFTDPNPSSTQAFYRTTTP